MWTKSEANDSSKGGARAPTPAPSVAPAHIARIGRSLSVKGDLYGEEDLFIDGRIEGKITVTLQNGAQFKGSIDMESAGGGKESQASGAVSGKSNGLTQRL